MNKNMYIAVGGVLLVLVVLLSLQSSGGDDKTSPTGAGKLVTGLPSETFSGTITAVDTGCFSDAVCSVSVDGKKVILVQGGRGQSPDIKVGKLIGVNSIGDLEQNIGHRANVFATTTPAGDYTLYGNNGYYVEVVALKKNGNNMSFFITSVNPGKGGDLGGLSGADNYCQTLAASAGAGDKTWRAYVSTQASAGAAAVNARDRIGNGPWMNFNGQIIANNVAELHANNMINKQSGLTQTGAVVNGRGDTPNWHDILTGSGPDGRAIATTTDVTCGNWTKSAGGSAMLGHFDRMGTSDTPAAHSWNSAHLSRGCSLPELATTGSGGLLYCFALSK